MNKKTSIIIIFLVVLSILFSGCLEGFKPLDIHTKSSNNFHPVAVILAPNKAYFGDSIEFDATKSYDSDGKIVFYTWAFGDGDTDEGKKVKHSYKLEDDLNIEYPLIYTITLLIMDNNGAGIAKCHEVKVYPRTYVFYFRSGSLEIEKPSSDKGEIKASFGILNLNPLQVQTYELEKPINISPCSWNVTLYLKKPWLTRLSKVKLIFYDSNNNEISGNTANYNMFGIHLDGCNNITILGNRANYNVFGIHLYGCNNNNISGNTANNNIHSWGGVGILIYGFKNTST